jgi:hypothetical protein
MQKSPWRVFVSKSKSRQQHNRNTFNISANTEQRIRQRAYELHQQRGGVHGFALDDWLQAEVEILGTREQPNVKETAGSK